jgi:hypothetical protein
MAQIEEGQGTLKITRGRTGASLSAVILYFIVGGLGVVAAPAFVVMRQLEPTKTIECQRSTSRCQLGSSFTFPLTQLKDLQAYPEGKHHYTLASVVNGQPSYWAGAVSSDEELSALQAAVDRLHAFAEGTEPSIHVEVPGGAAVPGTSVSVFMFLVGLGFLYVGNRPIWRMSLVATSTRTTVETRRALIGRRRTELSPGDVTGVDTYFTTYRYMRMNLRTRSGAIVPLVCEQRSSRSTVEVRELAERLGRFFGVSARA